MATVVPDALSAIRFALLLLASFAHLLWVQRTVWPLHGTLAALFSALLAMWIATCGQVLHLPLFLALWSVLLVGIASLGTRRLWSSHLRVAIHIWRTWSPLLTVMLWIPYPGIPLPEHLLILAILGAYAAGLGWQRQHRVWLFAAMLTAVVQLHGWWWIALSPWHLALLWPWSTVQLVLLAGLAFWGKERLQRLCNQHLEALPEASSQGSSWPPVVQALTWLLPCLLVSA